MTKVKNEIFPAKMVEISNFELLKSYIPQKKAENMYKTDSARRSKISCQKISKNNPKFPFLERNKIMSFGEKGLSKITS